MMRKATNDDTEAELGRVSEGLSVVSQNMVNLFAMVLLNCNRRSGFGSRGSEQRAEFPSFKEAGTTSS